MDAIRAHSFKSGVSGGPEISAGLDGDGCLDVASACGQWQGVVVSDNDQVVAALGEVAGLFESPGYGQSFTFDGCVPLLGRGQKASASQRYSPTVRAAVGCTAWTGAVLLEEEITDSPL